MEKTTGGERVGFRRHAGLPGVEVRDFEDSSRRWRCYATGFELFVPRTWKGEVRYGRRQAVVGPGMLFCARPQDVFTTPRILRAGSASTISIEAEAFDRQLAAHGLRARNLRLTNVVTMSPMLRSRVDEMLDLVSPATPAARMQSVLAELVAALVKETAAVDGGGGGDSNADTDLERLVEQTRFSRYQVLRVFKRRHGLPPHAYQLLVRIGLAQRSLRAGAPAADVAIEQGFVDQSHFTRHFKQLVGVTPVQYARADRGRGGARAGELLQ